MLQKDPRVERSQRVILDAALAELAGVGWGAFSIDAVARRAGVARSTVYRHWTDKRSLVIDALEHQSVQPPPEDSAPGRPRVVALVRHLAEVMADGQRSAIAVALIGAAEQEPALRRLHRRFSDRRRHALVVALDDAGVPDPELTAMALAGAVVYGRMMGGKPVRPEQAEALVNAVLGPDRAKLKRR